jgi:UDP-glucose 4-epimerase
MKLTIFGGGVFISSTKADRLLKDTTMNCVFLSAYDESNAIEGVDVVLHLVSTTLPKSFNNNPVYDIKSKPVYLSIRPNHVYPSP